MPSFTRQLADTLIRFVFPPTCVNCQKVGTLLCADCMAEMPWIRGAICHRCGRPTSPTVTTCANCRRQPLRLQQVRAALLYVDPVTHIIHKMKYNNLFGLAEPLAGLMLQAWPAWQSDIDLIVPVPLHARRQKQRGFNQSALLAAHLGRHLDLPVRADALQRVRHTRPQVGLDAQDRQVNVQGAFRANGRFTAGRHILLVDDVYTTGATMSAAAETLLAAGATAVSAYCVARAA